LLLSSGAKDHERALRMASQIGHKEIVDLLKSYTEA
jgi:hypothetical protein